MDPIGCSQLFWAEFNQLATVKDHYQELNEWDWSAIQKTRLPVVVRGDHGMAMLKSRGKAIPITRENLERLSVKTHKKSLDEAAGDVNKFVKFPPTAVVVRETPQAPPDELLECYVQLGPQLVPFHVDDASQFTHIPASLPNATKIWVLFCKEMFLNQTRFREHFTLNPGTTIKGIMNSARTGATVIIQKPGDTVVFRAGTVHAVLTVYPPETQYNDQITMLIFRDFAFADDATACHRLNQTTQIGKASNLSHLNTGMNRQMQMFEKIQPGTSTGDSRVDVRNLAAEADEMRLTGSRGPTRAQKLKLRALQMVIKREEKKKVKRLGH